MTVIEKDAPQRPPRDLSIVVIVVMMVGWVVSVGIRSWQGAPVEVVAEMTGAAVACTVMWKALMGKGKGKDEGDTP